MNVTIKNLPASLHRNLKKRAAANKRSLNQEVIGILEQALEPKPLDIEAFLAEAQQERARFQGPQLTEEFLLQAKTQGRP